MCDFLWQGKHNRLQLEHCALGGTDLKELLKGDIIEGPLPLEDATGWVSNVVIESKKWDSRKIRLTLVTRMIGDFILQNGSDFNPQL